MSANYDKINMTNNNSYLLYMLLHIECKHKKRGVNDLSYLNMLVMNILYPTSLASESDSKTSMLPLYK